MFLNAQAGVGKRMNIRIQDAFLYLLGTKMLYGRDKGRTMT